MRQLGFLRNPTALLILAWVFYLVYLSSTPRLILLPLLPRSLVSGAAHVIAYFILASLIYMAMARSRPGLLGGLRSAAAAIAIATVIGVAVEAIQGVLPERSAEVSDVVLNVAGVLLGVGATVFLRVVGLPRRLMSFAIGSAIALVVVGIAGSSAVWNPDYPYVGDHWHSAYAISVCGIRQPDLPGAPGGVHSHGGELLHVHPRDPSEAGKNATLGLAFRTSGGGLTGTSMTLPWGTSFTNGDLCPDGRVGELAVFVDGVRIVEPGNYVLRDQQTIIIMFGAAESGDQV